MKLRAIGIWKGRREWDDTLPGKEDFVKRSEEIKASFPLNSSFFFFLLLLFYSLKRNKASFPNKANLLFIHQPVLCGPVSH